MSSSSIASQFGCVHMAESVNLRRSYSIACVREFEDEETMANGTFQVPGAMKAIKVQNLKGSGRLDLVKFLKDLTKFGYTVHDVALFTSSKSDPYAFIKMEPTEADRLIDLIDTMSALKKKGKASHIGNRPAKLVDMEWNELVQASLEVDQGVSFVWQQIAA